MSTTDSAAAGRRVGDLAEAAGLTVRTLHYYEEIGLLSPERTDAGHRVYSDADVERLYRVSLLGRLGLPLAEISRALDEPSWNLHAAMTAHLAELERRLEVEGRLRSRLTRLVSSAESSATSRTTDLLEILEEMTMLENAVQQRISILVYADLEAAFIHLTEVYGLGPGQLTRADDGTPVHGEIEAGDGVLWLHPESPEHGLASPQRVGAATATMAIMVEDVDAHYRHALEHGADIRYEPVDQPYGYREYGAADPEGGVWSFMKRLDQ